MSIIYLEDKIKIKGRHNLALFPHLGPGLASEMAQIIVSLGSTEKF